ncbi:MAG TPA: carbamoyltransferase HypF [Solirubrobacterales bacterium]|nr:carbamoyltransferase HypF [Solirubrobacterales bacterium]
MSVGARQRLRVRVEGTVQGVGFRPFVYRLASDLGLGGWVLNDSRGVLIEAEGEREALETMLERLRTDAPPLAIVERIADEARTSRGETEFRITESAEGVEAAAAVSADVATCDDCLAELFGPSDRRHRYPFTNCTNCGPRFTIVRGVPYDRPLTTMASFEMCARCRAEYEDPLDRRFHAQPNACPDCGPSLRLVDRAGRSLAEGNESSLEAAVLALAEGRIVAVKGLGGYHLACRADDESVVAELRARKHREDKPFALMAPSAESALGLVELDDAAGALLASRERPIVLAPRRPDAPVGHSVAPASRELGVMLPYSPLHHLLLADSAAVLVMTSANVSDEPIAFRDDDALGRLAGIADVFLVHDRPIETRTDDSVVRVVSGRPLFLRRSRGYVPRDLPLRTPRAVLACGAELKNTFCLAKGDRAWVGHHIGDLKNYETLRSFTEGIEHFEQLFDVEPELVAHDLHPEYLSTKYALEREGAETVGVQHHHAHFAACLAEHGEGGRAVGAIYDGTGYGTDGTVWGGELLVGDARDFERAGHLYPVRMPGGERAITQPWRMACSWLLETLGDEPPLPPLLTERVAEEEWSKVAELAVSGLASPVTSSAGRLFDAVAALCGIRAKVNYEGQAAVELEAAADQAVRGSYPLTGTELLDARETLVAILADLGAGVPVPAVAAKFHNAMAEATARACAELARADGIEVAVLSGGVFQNRLLLERTAEALERQGLRVLTPRLLPPNDGGIAFGQAAVAAARS